VFDLNRLINIKPFSMPQAEKAALYGDALGDLTRHHYANCPQYRRILDALGFDPAVKRPVRDMPFIPVRLFKDYELMSVERSRIIKTMTSSGTTGGSVSRIFLDRTTASNQTKALARIVSDFIGEKRLPMLIIDAKKTLSDRNLFSARGVGILGFSMMGRDITYALDDDMAIDLDSVKGFCGRHKDEEVMLFGFTYMIWEYLYKKLSGARAAPTFENAVLFHGGGWKRLGEQAVDNATFKRSLGEACGIGRVHNYYGMVEQTGSIFMECEKGYLHSSIFSDIIIRDTGFEARGMRETGLAQLISLLPMSYPGHSILSEDIGEIIGEDDCPCGRLGRYFRIHGRAREAEIRGCSDAYL
jgi:phenylacetate-coenzyme A ligase PaaK-like adenylate-forming protein